jgi:hypothetical protein
MLHGRTIRVSYFSRYEYSGRRGGMWLVSWFASFEFSGGCVCNLSCHHSLYFISVSPAGLAAAPPFHLPLLSKSRRGISKPVINAQQYTNQTLNTMTDSSNSPKPYNCPVCDRKFGRSEHLRRHASAHANVKPFQCRFCQKRFARK